MAIVSRQSEYGAQFEPTRFGWSPRRSSGLVSHLADVDQSLPEISDGNRLDVLGPRTQNEAAEVLGDSSNGQNEEINAPSPQAGGWNPDTANTPSHWLQQAPQAGPHMRHWRRYTSGARSPQHRISTVTVMPAVVRRRLEDIMIWVSVLTNALPVASKAHPPHNASAAWSSSGSSFSPMGTAQLARQLQPSPTVEDALKTTTPDTVPRKVTKPLRSSTFTFSSWRSFSRSGTQGLDEAPMTPRAASAPGTPRSGGSRRSLSSPRTPVPLAKGRKRRNIGGYHPKVDPKKEAQAAAVYDGYE